MRFDTFMLIDGLALFIKAHMLLDHSGTVYHFILQIHERKSTNFCHFKSTFSILIYLDAFLSVYAA